MLHLLRLHLTNLATHAQTTLDLPSRGLVALTGGNGAGKSTLLEGVATALWGESLRGEPSWIVGEPGEVTVELGGLKVTRKRSKSGTSKLEWGMAGTPAVTYETTSKAQAGLEAVIGSYDVWRRTCVLSSLDSAAFSLARDSDRKRLLEEFLGLALFDVALDACRKDKKEAASKAQKAEAECEKINLQLSFARTTLANAKKELGMLPTEERDLTSLRDDGQRLAHLCEAATKDSREATKKIAALVQAQAEATATLNAEKARLAKLSKDSCVTCGQNVTDMRAHLEREVSRLREEATRALAGIEADLMAARLLEEELQEEATTLNQKLGHLRTEYRLAEQAAKQRAGLAQKVLDAQSSVVEWEGKVGAALKEAKDASLALAHLDAVELVLGLRGVRAQVLDSSLTALEQQANGWLAQMPTEQGPLTISLTGSTTQKSGSVVDAISLRVRERPYDSCSGGERRRVDVALLLALRELAVAAHGRDGSLFCDEVFDALDQQGQADVSAALAEMAQDRLVMVITHSPDMVRALNPLMHLHVSLDDGKAVVKPV